MNLKSILVSGSLLMALVTPSFAQEAPVDQQPVTEGYSNPTQQCRDKVELFEADAGECYQTLDRKTCLAASTEGHEAARCVRHLRVGRDNPGY